VEKIEKEHQEKIMERIKKAGDSENYETSWNETGVPYKIKKKTEIKRGKKSRAAGARFELIVRADLESKGRTVSKWANNIDLKTNKIISSKRKFNPFFKVLTIGTGFPDFISIQHVHDELYSVIGIEVKTNGTLSKEEKEKCRWYLKNRTFSKILIAKKGKKRGEIEYIDFSEKYALKEKDAKE
jgi:hypothetical protein